MVSTPGKHKTEGTSMIIVGERNEQIFTISFI